MLTIKAFDSDMRLLVAALIQDIGDEYRAYDSEPGDDDDSAPSMLLTIGADDSGWSYQTGDNSYTGGAYGYATWAIVALYRDSVPADVAADITDQLYELAPDDAPIFIDDDTADAADPSNGGAH